MEPCTVGVDLGGTKVEVALLDHEGRTLATERRATASARGPDSVVEEIVALVQGVLAGAGRPPVWGVGVGVAGQVESGTGTVLFAPNLRWERYPLKEELGAALQLPIAVLNDVQAATYGEWRLGAGQGADDIACLFVGTGIGGGIVSAGRLLVGCSGSAGEIGHLPIARDGPLCRCGNRGCLEAFAAGWAIGRRAREAVAADPSAGASLLRLAGGTVANVTARVVARAAAQGDPLARQLTDEVGRALATGAGAIVNALNPCRLIFGGGVIAGMPQLLEAVRRDIASWALAAPLAKVQITTAALGPHAGSVGAAAWARDLMAPAPEGAG